MCSADLDTEPTRHQALEVELKPNLLCLYGLITTCCLIEIALRLADLGVVWPTSMRNTVYDYGAFWPGLLDNWKPNYSAQPYSMFITYGFLHSGVMHLVVNMLTLWSLGGAVLNRTGQGGFVVLFVVTVIGGGAGFGLLAPGLRPMVGASGALFGLLGAILAWEYVDHHTDRKGRWNVARVVLLLVGLNLVLWWAMNGQLAWQAHLGGFLVGWIAAFLIDPRPIEKL